MRTLVSRIMVSLAVCWVIGAVSTCKVLAERAKRPNVIVIMTDDQGYGDLACHGNPKLKTPNLDALSAESIRFTDFHVAPFCTPTRAALMTGRYPGRTGAYRTSSGRTSLHQREKTLGDLFTINGYATGMFGNGTSVTMRRHDRWTKASSAQCGIDVVVSLKSLITGAMIILMIRTWSEINGRSSTATAQTCGLMRR